jgi:hypothetical protein
MDIKKDLHRVTSREVRRQGKDCCSNVNFVCFLCSKCLTNLPHLEPRGKPSSFEYA